MKKSILLLLLSITTFFNYAVDFHHQKNIDRHRQDKFIGISAGVQQEDDDTLFLLQLTGDFRFKYIKLGAVVPLRILLYDYNDDTDTVMRFPEKDWDNARDYVALATYVQYGHLGDEYYARLSTLENIYIGNGTILGAYFNTLRYNHPKRGVRAVINTDYAGIDFLTDDVMHPNIVGARTYVKPFAFINKNIYLNNLEAGFSIFSDLFMPQEVTIAQNNEREVAVTTQYIMGVDARFKIYSNTFFSIEPYADLNIMSFAGNGFHVGVRNWFDIPAGIDFQIENRFEFRLYESNYMPTYFNSFYDVNKEYDRGAFTRYKLLSRSLLSSLDMLNGIYGDVVFNVVSLFSVGGSIESNEYYTADGKTKKRKVAFTLFTNLTFDEFLNLSVLFTHNNVTSGSLFQLEDDDMLLRANLLYNISDSMTAGISFAKKWRLYQTAGNWNYEYYGDVRVGVMVGAQF